MSQQMVNLKWKYFHTNIISSLSGGFTATEFTDVILVSDDLIPFPAHRIVLSASSPVLKDLLLDNPSSPPLIFLRGVNQQELCSILQFMYCGEITISENSVKQVLNNARELQIKHLTDTYGIGNNIECKENIQVDIKIEIFEESRHFGNISNNEDDAKVEKSTKSISDTLEEILALDIPTNKPEVNGSDYDISIYYGI